MPAVAIATPNIAATAAAMRGRAAGPRLRGRRRRRRAGEVEDGARRAGAGPRLAEPLAHLGEGSENGISTRVFVEQCDELVGNAGAGDLPLHQLGYSAPTGDQVDERDIAHANQRFRQIIGKPGSPVNDHHRRVGEGRLQRRGAGADHRGAAVLEARVVVVFDQMDVLDEVGVGRLQLAVQLDVDRSRYRHQKTRPADPLHQPCGRLEHRRQVALDLDAAAPRQQADPGVFGRHAVPLAERGAIRAQLDDIQQRMADELHPQPGGRVEVLLERQDDQQEVGERRHRLDPARAPGPYLRADVVGDRHLGEAAAKPPRQHQIEIRIVDEDDGVDPPLGGRVGQRAQGLADVAQVADHLGDADHGEVPHVVQELGPGVPHPAAADAEDLDPGLDIAHRADQAGAVQVAGGFAGDQHDRRRLGAAILPPPIWLRIPWHLPILGRWIAPIDPFDDVIAPTPHAPFDWRGQEASRGVALAAGRPAAPCYPSSSPARP
jgi:hypothetical protein